MCCNCLWMVSILLRYILTAEFNQSINSLNNIDYNSIIHMNYNTYLIQFNIVLVVDILGYPGFHQSLRQVHIDQLLDLQHQNLLV